MTKLLTFTTLENVVKLHECFRELIMRVIEIMLMCFFVYVLVPLWTWVCCVQRVFIPHAVTCASICCQSIGMSLGNVTISVIKIACHTHLIFWKESERTAERIRFSLRICVPISLPLSEKGVPFSFALSSVSRGFVQFAYHKTNDSRPKMKKMDDATHERVMCLLCRPKSFPTHLH